jgi:hypothetical protein
MFNSYILSFNDQGDGASKPFQRFGITSTPEPRGNLADDPGRVVTDDLFPG